jgi:predicted ester cyclase
LYRVCHNIGRIEGTGKADQHDGREQGNRKAGLRDHLDGGLRAGRRDLDQDAPDNELLPHDPPAKLIDTFKETFSEARESFPDLSITVEDVMAEGDRVVALVVMRGTHRGEFQGIAPTGKRVDVKAIDMFRISGGKIVEHWGHADDPTDFLRQSQCS